MSDHSYKCENTSSCTCCGCDRDRLKARAELAEARLAVAVEALQRVSHDYVDMRDALARIEAMK